MSEIKNTPFCGRLGAALKTAEAKGEKTVTVNVDDLRFIYDRYQDWFNLTYPAPKSEPHEKPKRRPR